MIKTIETQNCISFNILGKNRLASAEFNSMNWDHIVEEDLEKVLSLNKHAKELKWFWFARLIVPDGFEPKNAAILLMKEVSSWVDKRQNVAVYDCINPYGRLSLEGIIKLNLLFGFKLLDPKGVMVRLPKKMRNEENESV
jgi:hypothetical protein